MSRLLTVAETAAYLRVSQSWVRRHLYELPVERHGRLIRIDSAHLESYSGSGKSLIPERVTVMVKRYQCGSVRLEGRKKKMWYGYFREDSPEGRRQRHIPLGSLEELPTKAAARRKLRELMAGGAPPPKSSVTFGQLAQRWTESEGVALGITTLGHYTAALRAYVLPKWADRRIDTIDRESIQMLLKEQAKKYSRSSLKSLRLVVKMVLAWGERNGDIVRPNGWLDGIRLPKKTGGRKLVRTVLTAEQSLGIITRLKEPYQTLALLIAATGRRIEEGIGMQPTDLDGQNVLHIRRIIYDGRVEELEQEQLLPLDSPEHGELVQRLRALGEGHTWLFRSRKGTPVNPGNALRRYLHPAAKAVGVTIGGWHDFRHTLTTKLRKNGVHPKVIAGVLGHKNVTLAPNVYDHCDTNEIRSALGVVGKGLLRTCYGEQLDAP